CSKLEVCRFCQRKALVEHQVELAEAWTTKSIALQVSERSRKRYRKGRRIDQAAIVVQVWINSGYDIGPPDIARSATARRVNHTDETDRQRPTRELGHKSVLNRGGNTIDRDRTTRCCALHHHIRPCNPNFNRKTTARVNYSANLPVSEQRITKTSKLVTGAFSEWQFVERADVERMPHVEIVVAAIRFEDVGNR